MRIDIKKQYSQYEVMRLALVGWLLAITFDSDTLNGLVIFTLFVWIIADIWAWMQKEREL